MHQWTVVIQPSKTSLLKSNPTMLVWNEGSWSPLWDYDWFPSKVSNHMFDPNSFLHIIHGIFINLLLGRFIPSFVGLPVAILLEISWEYLENTDFWIDKTSGPSANYQENRESIQHVIGAVICCSVGYILSNFFLIIGFWWFSIIWIVTSEVGCLVYMRDSLVLMVAMMIYQVERVKDWQEEAIPQVKNMMNKIKAEAGLD